MKTKLIVIPENGLPVEKLKGQYCSRKIGGKIGKEVYQVEGYCRESKKYCLQAQSDINKQFYVKKGTILYEPNWEE